MRRLYCKFLCVKSWTVMLIETKYNGITHITHNASKWVQRGNHKRLPLHIVIYCRGNPLWLPLYGCPFTKHHHGMELSVYCTNCHFVEAMCVTSAHKPEIVFLDPPSRIHLPITRLTCRPFSFFHLQWVPPFSPSPRPLYTKLVYFKSWIENREQRIYSAYYYLIPNLNWNLFYGCYPFLGIVSVLHKLIFKTCII